jgi:hypothetical protein
MEELPPLLRLSPPVRCRIYIFLGLGSFVKDHPYEINLHNGNIRRSPLKPGTFHGLLLSYRAIYAETAALLYSANRFILRCDPAYPDPFRPLHALTTTALAALTSLTIILNQASCHHEDGNYHWCCLEGHELNPPWGAFWGCRTFHRDSHQLPLLTRPPRSQPNSEPKPNGDDNYTDKLTTARDLIEKWHTAAACLARITSGRLELALVCDLDPHHAHAPEIAALVTAPLGRLIPQLRDCRIRLCKTPDHRLQQIARDGVLQACRIARPPYDSPNPSTRNPQATFTSLPRELRLRILEYTDLIIPNREVTWSRQDQRYVTSVRNWYHDENLRPFFRCWDPLGSWDFIGCFCRRRHTSFSLECKCWAPPPPLFLICRTLCRDAQLTFFTGNRFIVHDYKDHPCWAVPSLDEKEQEEPESSQGPGQPDGPEGPTSCNGYPNDCFAASQFLRQVVPVHCLAYLRFLELVFPPYLAQTWPRGGDGVMQDWHATVDWLQDKINAPGLTLRLVVAEVSCDSPRAYTTRSSPGPTPPLSG